MKDYVNDVVLPDLRTIDKDTLCWDCKKYCGGCSWTRPDDGRPVKGWNAKLTDRGYVVRQCPEFMRDAYCRGRYKSPDDYIEALEGALMAKYGTIDRLRGIARALRSELIKTLWTLEVHQSE